MIFNVDQKALRWRTTTSSTATSFSAGKRSRFSRGMRVLVKHQLELEQSQDPRREAIFSSGQNEEERNHEDCITTIIISTYVRALTTKNVFRLAFVIMVVVYGTNALTLKII